MDLDRVKKFFSLFLAALGIFALVFIAYTIVLVGKMTADRKKIQKIKQDYASERISPAPSPTVLP